MGAIHPEAPHHAFAITAEFGREGRTGVDDAMPQQIQGYRGCLHPVGGQSANARHER